MVLELLNYINDDLKWNTVKKGRRSVAGRPRKLGENCFLSNKSGTDVLGRQAAKKKRVLGQSPSPPPQTTCLHGDGVLSPGPQTPSVHYEDPSQRCRSSSLSQKSKSKSRLKQTKKEYDFSGIELLAAAACSSFIDDNAEVKNVSAVKEQTTPGVNSCNVDIKEAIISTESDVSSIQEKKVAPLKELRLHWDLNTVMDDWDKACDDLVVKPDSEGVKLNLEAVPLIESCNGDSFGIRNDLVKDLSCSGEVMGTKTNTSKTSDCESCVSKSDMGDSLVQQPSSEETVQVLCESPKLCKSEDPASECGSNVSEADRMGKVEVGYESPFEDGELRESVDKSDNNKEDVGIIENPLSEKLEVSREHGQTDANSQRDVEESDCGSGKVVSGRNVGHGESRSFGGYESTCFQRDKEHIRGGYVDWNGSQRHRNYGYRHRPQNRRSERNSGYGIHGVRSVSHDRYWRRAPEEERKVGCYSVRRRSRSRSGSPPIAWHFRNQKN